MNLWPCRRREAALLAEIDERKASLDQAIRERRDTVASTLVASREANRRLRRNQIVMRVKESATFLRTHGLFEEGMPWNYDEDRHE